LSYIFQFTFLYWYSLAASSAPKLFGVTGNGMQPEVIILSKNGLEPMETLVQPCLAGENPFTDS
jgi:hypothetical protein